MEPFENSNIFKKNISINDDDLIYINRTLSKNAIIKSIIKIVDQFTGKKRIYFFDSSEDWTIIDEDISEEFIIQIEILNQLDCKKATGWLIKRGKESNIGQLPVEHFKKDLKYDINFELHASGQGVSPVFMRRDNDYEPISHYVCILTKLKDNCKSINIIHSLTTVIKLPRFLPSREEYKVELLGVTKRLHGYKVRSGGQKIFKTYNTIHDLDKLYTMAREYIMTKQRLPWSVYKAYRNKPTTHPNMQDALRSGIMKKYKKDPSGDPYSSINNNIDGLFFMLTPDLSTGEIPHESFFGDYRIVVPITYLLQGKNLYFADFYCMTGKVHYVTLVATTPFSSEDKYCSKWLIKLDPLSNDFMKYDRTRRCYNIIRSRSFLHVELLYTEDIYLRILRLQDGYEEYCLPPHLVRGESQPQGIPKNSDCRLCNIPSS